MSESSNLTEAQQNNRIAGAQAAGILASAFSSFSAGRANRYIARANQEMSEMQARDAITRGREAEQRLRRDAKQFIGSQRSQIAAQGVALGDADSSAADIQEDTAYLAELDALTIRNNARREAFGYRMQGMNTGMNSAIQSSAARQQGWATLISGAGSTYMTYRQLRDNG